MSQQLDGDAGLMSSRALLDDEWESADEEPTRRKLWRACLMYTGMQGLQELARTGLEEYGTEVKTLNEETKKRLLDLSHRIPSVPNVAKKTKPEATRIPKTGPGWRPDRYTCIWPDLMGDLTIFIDW